MPTTKQVKPVKSKAIHTDWLKNASKSIGGATVNELKSYAPNVSSILGSTASVAKRATQIKKPMSERQAEQKLNSNKYVKAVDRAFKNALTDLKQGYIFGNEDRTSAEDVDSMFEEAASASGVTFGDSGDTINYINAAPSTSALNGIGESIVTSAEMNVKMTKAQTDAQIAVMGTSMAQMSQISNSILTSLSGIENNLAALVEYNNTNMNNYIESATAYFEKIGAAQEEESKSDGAVDLSQVMYGGKFDIQAYKKYVKNNLRKHFSEADSIMSMMNDGMLDMIADNPLGMIPEVVIGYAMPQILETSIKGMEQTFNAAMPALMAGLQEWGQQQGNTMVGGMIRRLTNALGFDNDSKNVYYDVADIKVNRGAIPFDGETKTYITHVIPSLLSESTGYLKNISEYIENKKFQDKLNTTQNDKNTIVDREHGRIYHYEGDPNDLRRDLTRSQHRYYQTHKDEIDRDPNLMRQFYTNRRITDVESAESNNAKIADNRQVWNIEKNQFESVDQLVQSTRESILDGITNGIQSLNIGKRVNEAIGNDETMKAINQVFESQRIANKDDYQYNTRIQEAILAASDSRRQGRQLGMDNDAYRELAEAIGYDVDKNGNFDTKSTANQELVRNLNAFLSMYGNLLENDPLSNMEFRTVGQFGYNGLRNQQRKIMSDNPTTALATVGKLTDIDPMSGEPLSIQEQARKDAAEAYRRQSERARTQREINGTVKSEYDTSAMNERIENSQTGREARELFQRLGADAATGGKNFMSSILSGDKKGMYSAMGQTFGAMATTVMDSMNKHFFQPVKNMLFGERGDDGFYEGGLLANTENAIVDMTYEVSHRITGKPYKDSKGVDHPSDPNAVTGQIKSAVNTVLFGDDKVDKDGNVIGHGEGLLSAVTDTVKKGLVNWHNQLFGNFSKDGDEVNEDNVIQLVKDTVSENLSDAAMGAAGGAAIGLASGGLLGALIGGPIGGAAIGAAASILNKNEAFQTWLFGDEDKDNGFISKSTQEFFSKNKTAIIGGTAVGAVGGTITGAGFLGNLVGGPIGGALLGMGASIVAKSESFQNFLFGDQERGRPGIIRQFKGIFKQTQDELGENMPTRTKVGSALVGTAGGALTAGIIGQVGLLGAALTPGGIVGGALIGLGLGIKSSGAKFQEFLFGNGEDKNSINYKAGILGQFNNMLQAHVLYPMRNQFRNMVEDLGDTIQFEVLDAVEEITEPVVDLVKNTAGKIGDHALSIFEKVFGFVGEKAGTPIVNAVKNFVVKPIMSFGGMIAKAGTFVVKNAIAAPFRVARIVANALINPVLNVVGTFAKKVAGLGRKAISATFGRAINAVVTPIVSKVFGGAKGIVSAVSQSLRDSITGRAERRAQRKQEKYDAKWGGGREGRMNRSREAYDRSVKRGRMRKNENGEYISYDEYIQDRAYADYQEALKNGTIDPDMSIEDYVNTVWEGDYSTYEDMIRESKMKKGEMKSLHKLNKRQRKQQDKNQQLIASVTGNSQFEDTEANRAIVETMLGRKVDWGRVKPVESKAAVKLNDGSHMSDKALMNARPEMLTPEARQAQVALKQLHLLEGIADDIATPEQKAAAKNQTQQAKDDKIKEYENAGQKAPSIYDKEDSGGILRRLKSDASKGFNTDKSQYGMIVTWLRENGKILEGENVDNWSLKTLRDEAYRRGGTELVEYLNGIASKGRESDRDLTKDENITLLESIAKQQDEAQFDWIMKHVGDDEKRARMLAEKGWTENGERILTNDKGEALKDEEGNVRTEKIFNNVPKRSRWANRRALRQERRAADRAEREAWANKLRGMDSISSDDLDDLPHYAEGKKSTEPKNPMAPKTLSVVGEDGPELQWVGDEDNITPANEAQPLNAVISGIEPDVLTQLVKELSEKYDSNEEFVQALTDEINKLNTTTAKVADNTEATKEATEKSADFTTKMVDGEIGFDTDGNGNYEAIVGEVNETSEDVADQQRANADKERMNSGSYQKRRGILGRAGKAISNAAGNAVESVKDTAASVGSGLFSSLKKLGMGAIILAVGSAITKAGGAEAIGNALGSAVTFLANNLPTIIEGMSDAITTIGTFISDHGAEIVEGVSSIANVLGDIGGSVLSIAGKFLGGTASGVAEYADSYEYASENDTTTNDEDATESTAVQATNVAEGVVDLGTDLYASGRTFAANRATRKAATEAAEAATGTAVKKGVVQSGKELAEDVSSAKSITGSLVGQGADAANGDTLVTKAIKAVEEALYTFFDKCSNKILGKSLDNTTVGKLVSNVIGSVNDFISSATSAIYNTLVEKLTAIFGGETAAYIATAGTALIVNITFTAIESVGGTAKLFYVNEDDVDAGMDIIAACFVVLKSIPYVGSILEILDALMTMCGKTGILTGMAYAAYNGIYGLFVEDASAKLDEATSKFKEEYEDYNTTQLYNEYDNLVAAGLSPTDEDGNIITREQYADEVIAGTREGTTTSFADYNTMENKDLSDKVVSGAVSAATTVGKGITGTGRAVANTLANTVGGGFTYHYYDTDQTESGNIYIKNGKKYDVYDTEGNKLSDDPVSATIVESDLLENATMRHTKDLTELFGENAGDVALDQDNGILQSAATVATNVANTVTEGVAHVINKGEYVADNTITYYNDTQDGTVYIKNGDTWDQYNNEGALIAEGVDEAEMLANVTGSVKGIKVQTTNDSDGYTELQANRIIFSNYDSEAVGSSENDWNIGKSYEDVESDVVGLADGYCWLDSSGCYYKMASDGTYTYCNIYGDELIRNISQSSMTDLVISDQLIMCKIKDASGAKANATNMYDEMYNNLTDGYVYEDEEDDDSTTEWTQNEDGTWTGTKANGEVVSDTATEEEVDAAVAAGQGTKSETATADTGKKYVYYTPSLDGNYWVPNDDGTYSLIQNGDGSVITTATAEEMKNDYGVEVDANGDSGFEANVMEVEHSRYSAYESANISDDGYGHTYTYTLNADGTTFTKRNDFGTVVAEDMSEDEVKAEVEDYNTRTEENPDDAYTYAQEAAKQTAYTEDESAKLDDGYVWEKNGDASRNYEYQSGSNNYAEIDLDTDKSVTTGYSLDDVRERATLVEPTELEEDYYHSASGYVLHGNQKSVYHFYDVDDENYKTKQTWDDGNGNLIKQVKKGTMTQWYKEGSIIPLDEYESDQAAEEKATVAEQYESAQSNPGVIMPDELSDYIESDLYGGNGEGVSVARKRGTSSVKMGGGFGSKLSTQNGFTYASQEDSRWADTKYEYDNDGGTMADSGCGPTAMSMVVSDMTGHDVTPTDMAQLAADTGNRDATGTNWNYISDAANSYGLNSTQTLNPDTDDILESVSSGNPVVLSGASTGFDTPYTSAGHYVVGVGLDNDGNVLVNDPRGTQYSRAYSPEELASYTGSSWEIDGGYGARKNRSHKFKRGGRGETYYYLSNGMYYVPTTVNGKTIYKLYTKNGKLVTKDTSNYSATLTEDQLKELITNKTVSKKTATTTQSSSVLNGGTSDATADMYSDSNGNYYKKNSDGTYSYYTKDGTLQNSKLTALKVGQLLADGTISETTEAEQSSVDTDMRNNFPFLLQADSRWGSTAYTASGDTTQTIANSGCGPTSMAMILRSYGNNVTPIDTSKWSVDNGYRTDNDGTAWGFFNAIGKEYGLTTNAYSSSNASSAFADLNNDIPLIASMGPGDFTSSGHFITLVGRKDGNILVNDPASTTRSDKTWSSSTIQNQANELWSFSKNGKGSINNLTDAGAINLAGGETTEAQIEANDASLSEGSTSFMSKYGSFLSSISDTLMQAAMTGDWSATDAQSIIDLWNNAGTTTTTAATTTTTGSYSTSTSGSDNEQKIWNYLTGTAGFSAAGAAGAMGNMYQESGLNPTAMEDWFESRLSPTYNDSTYTTAVDNGTYKTAKSSATYYGKSNYQYGGDFWNDKVGYGLIQWTSDDRKKGLYDAAKAANGSVGDIGVQLSYLLNEMNSNSYYKQAIPTMQSATDPYSAAGTWYKYIESGGGTMSGSQTKRGTKAQEYYNKYAGGGSGAGLPRSGESETKQIMMMPGGYGLSTGGTVTGSAATAREAIVGWMLCLIGQNTYTQSSDRSRVMEGVDGHGYGDCSSTCCKIYETALGMSIGSYTGNMYNKGTQILGPNTERGTYPDESYMLPGDLVFYYSGTPDANNLSSSIGHVEMYIGSGTLAGHGSGTGPKLKSMKTYRTSGSYGPWATVVRYIDESTTYNITLPDSSKYKQANQYTDGNGKSAGNLNVNAGATSTASTSTAATTTTTTESTFMGKYSNMLSGISDMLMEAATTGDWSGITSDAVVNLFNGTSTTTSTTSGTTTTTTDTTSSATAVALPGSEAVVRSADSYAATMLAAKANDEDWIYSNSSKYVKRSGSFSDMVRAADDGELQRGGDEKMIPTWILRNMGVLGDNTFVSGTQNNTIGGYVGSTKTAIDENFDVLDLSDENYPSVSTLKDNSEIRAGDILFGKGTSYVYGGDGVIYDSGHGTGNWTRKYSVESDDDQQAVFTKWRTKLADDTSAAKAQIHHIMRPKSDFTTTGYLDGAVSLASQSTDDSSTDTSTLTLTAAGEGSPGYQRRLEQEAMHAIHHDNRHEGDSAPSLRKRVTAKIGNVVDGLRGGKGGARKVQVKRKGGYGLDDGVVSSNAATTGLDVADNMTASEASIRSSAYIGASQSVSSAIDKVISDSNKSNSQDNTVQLLTSAIQLLQEIASNTSTSNDYLSQATQLIGSLNTGTSGSNNVFVTQQSDPLQPIDTTATNSTATTSRNLALAQRIAAGK